MPMTRNDARSSVQIRKLTYSALYLAIALVLPFLTGQIPEIGSMLCPMHIPALLCGFVCGWPWGLAVGFVSPLLRSLLFGMPTAYTAAAMAFELAAYGAVSGILYRIFPPQKLVCVCHFDRRYDRRPPGVGRCTVYDGGLAAYRV